jgi:hypothetical protein
VTYRSSSYTAGRRREVTPGRVARPNRRPGPCRACGEEIPAGAGQLWRETSGTWSVVHVPESQGGWLMHPEPVRGGCPQSTDARNAELLASGFFGQGVTAVTSERDRIADAAARYAATSVRETPARAGSKYAYTSTGARVTLSSRRCEDAPCCGCCD